MFKKIREKWKHREGRRDITKRILWGAVAGMLATAIILFLAR